MKIPATTKLDVRCQMPQCRCLSECSHCLLNCVPAHQLTRLLPLEIIGLVLVLGAELDPLRRTPVNDGPRLWRFPGVLPRAASRELGVALLVVALGGVESQERGVGLDDDPLAVKHGGRRVLGQERRSLARRRGRRGPWLLLSKICCLAAA